MDAAARRQGKEQGVRERADTRGRSSRSGRLLLRMPSELHDELSRLAEGDGVSLNQLIVSTLSQSLGRDVPREAESRPVPAKPRLLGVALVVNLVVVALAGIAAIGLLIAAWSAGF